MAVASDYQRWSSRVWPGVWQHVKLGNLQIQLSWKGKIAVTYIFDASIKWQTWPNFNHVSELCSYIIIYNNSMKHNKCWGRGFFSMFKGGCKCMPALVFQHMSTMWWSNLSLSKRGHPTTYVHACQSLRRFYEKCRAAVLSQNTSPQHVMHMYLVTYQVCLRLLL